MKKATKIFLLVIGIFFLAGWTGMLVYRKVYMKSRFAGETLTIQQKEAIEWIKKAGETDSPSLQIKYYTKAIELDPEYVGAYINRGVAYGKSGEYQKAMIDFTKTIGLDPEYAPAYYNRGLAYYFSDKYQEAIDDYTKAIELNPKYAMAYYNRGDAYVKSGEYRPAIDDFTKAIELNLEYAEVYYNRGLAYNFLRFPTTACDDFYQAGILYLKQGNRTEALKCADLMKEADSSSPLIKKLMDKIYVKP